jgi:drug/metabolite transporter (DMT)-like permease
MDSLAAQQQREALVRSMPVVFVLIWSTGFIVARYGMPHSPPFSFLMVRYVLSVACFLAWTSVMRAVWPRGMRQWGHLSVTGVLMHAAYLGGVWAAIKSGMGAGLAALLIGLQPVLTAVWISALGGSVTRRQWTGLALGLGGLVLVVWQKLGLGEVHALNLAFAVGALLSITMGTLYQKRFVAPCDVRTANLVQLAAAALITLPLALIESEPMRWFDGDGSVNGQIVGAMAWSVLALTLGGSSLLYLLIQRGAATSVTSLMYLVPPVTALMAWLLFDEPITALTLTGVALAAGGVALVIRAPAAAARV